MYVYEKYPTRRKVDEEFHGPESLHRVTFGSVPRTSLAVQLVDKSEIDDFTSGTGRFAEMKTAIEITTAEFYDYLRIGVSSQAAMALKFLGYPTPESLVESPVTTGLLPDVLTRRPYAYPVAFIERCEAEGVSPVGVQLAIRRGITDHYLASDLSVRQLVYLFQVHVNKNAPVSNSPERLEVPIDFICDGTIPFDAVVNGDIRSGRIMNAGKAFKSVSASEVVARLQSDAVLCRKFLTSVREIHGSKSVKILLRSIETYGIDVLDLQNSYLPVASFEVDGETVEVGLQTARYIEEVMDADSAGSPFRQDFYDYQGRLMFRDIGYADFNRLRKAGVPVQSVCDYVSDDGVGVDALIGAREHGIHADLMDGFL
jgi:hypothetical protein